MTEKGSALALARAQVAAVRDDPKGRLGLITRTYHGPTGRAPRHLPFRRAALSFMRWQAQRGVLNPLDGSPPGSPWWRKMNERLLQDGCEAVALAGGLAGPPSSPAVGLWLDLPEDVTPSGGAMRAAVSVGRFQRERSLDANGAGKPFDFKPGGVVVDLEVRVDAQPVRARRGYGGGRVDRKFAVSNVRRSGQRHGTIGIGGQRRELERHVRVPLDGEEVGRAKMRVALPDSGLIVSASTRRTPLALPASAMVSRS